MTGETALIRHLSIAPSPERHPWVLLCPFAGASRSAFATVRDVVIPGLSLSLVVYPGRDHRTGEGPRGDIPTLASELSEAVAAWPPALRRRLMLAGHSMGAQVAFEAALRLQACGSAPAGVVVSGCQAPHLRGRRLLSGLDDRHFVDQLIAIGGCDPRLQAEPLWLKAFLPMLRADFAATESYRRPLQDASKGARVQCPTLLMYGSRDAEASAEEVLAWAPWVAPDFVSRRIDGDHFFVTERIRAVAAVIVNFYRQRIAG